MRFVIFKIRLFQFLHNYLSGCDGSLDVVVPKGGYMRVSGDCEAYLHCLVCNMKVHLVYLEIDDEDNIG